MKVNKKYKRKKLTELPFKLNINKSAYLESTNFNSLKGAGYVFNITPYSDEAIQSDFSIREAFAYDIAGMMGVTDNPRELFIYTEYPDNYLEQLEIFREKKDNTIHVLYEEILEAITWSKTPYTAGINIRMKEYVLKHGRNTPQHLKDNYDKVSIIVVYQNTTNTKDVNASNYTWLFTHELFHSVHTKAGEPTIQKHTLDYLYEMGFVDSIGLEYVTHFYREYVKGMSRWASEYSIVQMLRAKLKSLGDYDLLYAYDTILYQLLIDNGYDDYAELVMDWINEIPEGSYDERAYEGVWL